MIKIENVVTPSPDIWQAVILGCRNPMNSWKSCDSHACSYEDGCDGCVNFNICNPNFEPYFRQWWEKGNYGSKFDFAIGPKDHKLLYNLAAAGPDHRKFMRMLPVYMDITAPLYWWKEFDTYKVGTVANSCSTMHKIHEKEFDMDDFSHEHLIGPFDSSTDDLLLDLSPDCDDGLYFSPLGMLAITIQMLNICRDKYLETKDKDYWWQMIQLLPSSYNQKRTVMLNYEVLHNIYHARKDHKLDEWVDLCKEIEKLPYSELITCKEEQNNENI